MASGVPGSPPGLPGPLRSAPPPSKGGTSEPSSSRLGDRPNPRHILWAASRLQEPLRDISALSWCYPDRKCHRCRPELLLNQPGRGGAGGDPQDTGASFCASPQPAGGGPPCSLWPAPTPHCTRRPSLALRTAPRCPPRTSGSQSWPTERTVAPSYHRHATKCCCQVRKPSGIGPGSAVVTGEGGT